MCQVLEGARVAPPDGSHRQRPGRQKTGSVATVYQDKAAGGQAHSSASPAAFPARATIFGCVIGSYAGSMASISAARILALACCGNRVAVFGVPGI